MAETSRVGTVAWHLLSVPDAETIRDFYDDVVGWRPQDRAVFAAPRAV